MSCKGKLSIVEVRRCLVEVYLSEVWSVSRKDLMLILSLKDTSSKDSVICYIPQGTKRAVIA